MIFGALIVFFLIVEPHGLARLWSTARKSCGSGPSRTDTTNERTLSPTHHRDAPLMETRHEIREPWPLRCCCRAPSLAAGLAAAAAFAQAKEQFFPVLAVPHRRLRAERRALGQRLRRLPQARQRARRHQRRQDHLRGVRDRLRHRQGRRVLRAAEGQARRRDAVPAAVHRHHLRPHRARRRATRSRWSRSATAAANRRTAASSSGTSRSPAPTGSPPTPSSRTSARRKAAWTSSRARRSPSSITTARTARSRSRCCRSVPKMLGFELQLLPVTAPGVEQKVDLAADPPEPARLRAAVGLGRDELDRASRKRRRPAIRARRCTAAGGRAPSPTSRTSATAPRATTP